MELGLLGVARLDPHGSDRLARALAGVDPDVICVEDTREDFARGVQAHKMLQLPENVDSALANAMSKLPGCNEETIRRLLTQAFYSDGVIFDYAVATQRRLVFCEDDGLLRGELIERAAEDMESSLIAQFRNSAVLTLEQLAAEVAFEYSMKEYPVRDMPELVKYYSDRDALTERMIRAQEGKVLYVGGLDHIYGNYSPNLFDRLADLFPERTKLCEFDS